MGPDPRIRVAVFPKMVRRPEFPPFGQITGPSSSIQAYHSLGSLVKRNLDCVPSSKQWPTVMGQRKSRSHMDLPPLDEKGRLDSQIVRDWVRTALDKGFSAAAVHQAQDTGRLNVDDMLRCLKDLVVTHGPREHIRSDSGSEFSDHAVRHRLERTWVRTLFIKPGSPLEDGYCESFNGKLREEVFDREIFSTFRETQGIIER